MSEAQTSVPALEVDPIESGQMSEGHGGIHWFVAVSLSFLISAALLASYHFWLAPKPAQFGMIDLEATLKHQQKVFADLVSKGDGNAAYDLAAKTGPRINLAIEQLARECACIVLVNHAVVSGVPDLTARMRQLMNDPVKGAIK